MGKVIHFEIPISNPDYIGFYQKVFGWKLNRYGEMPYWLATTGNDGDAGINGALILKSRETTVEEPRFIKNATEAVNAVITIDVKNLDETIQKVKDNGGQVVKDTSTVPGIGYMIYFIDPAGNLLGAMQEDRKAGL